VLLIVLRVKLEVQAGSGTRPALAGVPLRTARSYCLVALGAHFAVSPGCTLFSAGLFSLSGIAPCLGIGSASALYCLLTYFDVFCVVQRPSKGCLAHGQHWAGQQCLMQCAGSATALFWRGFFFSFLCCVARNVRASRSVSGKRLSDGGQPGS
jgi:hypothetical protein